MGSSPWGSKESETTEHTCTLCLNGFITLCLVTKPCPPLAIPWTVAHPAPLSMAFPRQEYWSELPFPSLGDLSDPGIKPASSAFTDGFFTPEPPEKPAAITVLYHNFSISKVLHFDNYILGNTYR